jgi:S1-C subfamily serine protease
MPHGLDFSVTRGIVSSGRREYRGRRLIRTDVSMSPGSSGGPLLDRQGYVVGICVRGHPQGPDLNFAVPVQSLTALLNRLESRPLDPGWHCRVCGDWRPDEERFCLSCGSSRQREQAPPTRPPVLAQGSDQRPDTSTLIGPWACPACAKDNEGSPRYCGRCGSPRRRLN